MPISRRVFLALGPVGAAMLPYASAARTAAAAVAPPENFPAHDPAHCPRHGRGVARQRRARARAALESPRDGQRHRGTGATETGRRRLAPPRTWATGRLPRCCSPPAPGRRSSRPRCSGNSTWSRPFITAAPGVERTRGRARHHARRARESRRRGRRRPLSRHPVRRERAVRGSTAGRAPNGRRWRARTRLALESRSAPDRRDERARRPRDPARRRRRATAVSSGIACLPPEPAPLPYASASSPARRPAR